MTSISTPVTPVVIQAQSPSPQVKQAIASPSSSSESTFGEAVNVSLSAPAQAVVANQPASSSTSPETSSAPVTPRAKEQASVAPTAAPVVNIAALISAAKQKVAPQVGINGASDVVDSKGNISKVQLAIEIAEQARKG